MKITNSLRLRAVLLIGALFVASLAMAQVGIGGRFAPKGTFTGDQATLMAISRLDADYAKCYLENFGPGWNEPGALTVEAKTHIPKGGLVPHNALRTIEGGVDYRNTIQTGDGDEAYYVRNTKSGKACWIKSCGQPCRLDAPPAPPKPGEKPQPIYFESDFEAKITLSSSSSADAEATATANARGGNAAVNFTAPQPIYVPQQRVLTTQSSERYQVGGITWLPQTRLTNTQNQDQNQNQDQLQLQWQLQWQQQQQQQQMQQQQLQEILNRLGIG